MLVENDSLTTRSSVRSRNSRKSQMEERDPAIMKQLNVLSTKFVVFDRTKPRLEAPTAFTVDDTPEDEPEAYDDIMDGRSFNDNAYLDSRKASMIPSLAENSRKNSVWSIPVGPVTPAGNFPAAPQRPLMNAQ